MGRELSNFMKANRREVNNGKYSVRFGPLQGMVLQKAHFFDGFTFAV